MITWRQYSLIAIGIWLFFTPNLVMENNSLMESSDQLSGLLIILFACCSWPLATVAVGVWLQIAPLVFWAPQAASYINDTLIGVAAIALAFLVPEKELASGVVLHEIPPGMKNNPSAWPSRIAVAFLALLACISARYMASYQLGYINSIWDPIFDQGNGTYYVLTSSISKAFPVSDAGLGAFSYVLDMLMALKGGTKRWRTMPWAVAFFGFLVVPVGIVSSILILLQPLVVGHFCFWCLLTAFFMFCMVFLAVDEVKASLRFVRSESRRGMSAWEVFWKGG